MNNNKQCGCEETDHVEAMTAQQIQDEWMHHFEEAYHREWMAHTDPQGYGYMWLCFCEYELIRDGKTERQQKQQWIFKNHAVLCCDRRHRNIQIALTCDK